ncbi:Calcineurin-like phosphoesterase [Dethiosulfatibacter aminovorans DSM 17477]|uniref:Calcineurin-like phosphoesterase n=1 Tax=Dethiosulfatibacter aminovorans DSM 17477 TaxID=1121476 RepID=A0A1M6GBD0_9FIRM|nr:metallophosphoesterase [Dethiosulfatibacter aminovorans]SHJ07197.1 Calcineurin-like phosphoesterase [Dethiosulfatibacter aminovorans DSM 17477]
MVNKFIKPTIILLSISLILGVSVFIYNANNDYSVSKHFVGLPLQYDAYESSSTYRFNDVDVIVFGGFVKGIINEKDGSQNLLIRALSPLPTIQIESDKTTSISLMLENINPDYYAQSVSDYGLPMAKLTVNTLQITVAVNQESTVSIDPTEPIDSADKYIVLGDNRDGYDTFEQIIQEINGLNPAFVIDNGDLVFNGKPNQYRLFDNLTAKISTTLCTTLGNHDIRGDGRQIYTMLYGPPYYSFDFSNSHFIFLDSSPGWSEMQAISDKQYVWLENDLKKSQRKKIYVISHIPPYDPRSDVSKNEIPNYIQMAESGENWVEKKLDNYYENMDMDHGFQDPEEARKFEELMSAYHVETVYLSHIHSYFDYYKDGVRYLISGGAGAELLTEDSYYHYLIAKFEDTNSLTMVELPSPSNYYIARYQATIKLFADALYKENTIAVVLLIAGFSLLVVLLAIKFYLWKKQTMDKFGKWLVDIAKYSVKRFKEIFSNK